MSVSQKHVHPSGGSMKRAIDGMNAANAVLGAVKKVPTQKAVKALKRVSSH